jgi:AcrR family transcriptional regulator
MRADAQRNRARLLEVASEVFAARGLTASTEEIAKAAGVGIGTVFRHFPTKEALLEAVFVGMLRRLAADAQALVAAAEPGPALFDYFTHVVEQAAMKRALGDALESAGMAPHPDAHVARGELERAMTALLTNAQRAGEVRTDIGVSDFTALLFGATRAAEHRQWDPATQNRILRVIFDGLRPVRNG